MKEIFKENTLFKNVLLISFKLILYGYFQGYCLWFRVLVFGKGLCFMVMVWVKVRELLKGKNY